MILCDQYKCSRREQCLRYKRTPNFGSTTYTDYSNGSPDSCKNFLSIAGMGVSLSSTADADKRNQKN